MMGPAETNGGMRSSARLAKMTTEEYTAQYNKGLRWCKFCKLWMPAAEHAGKGLACNKHNKKLQQAYLVEKQRGIKRTKGKK